MNMYLWFNVGVAYIVIAKSLHEADAKFKDRYSEEVLKRCHYDKDKLKVISSDVESNIFIVCGSLEIVNTECEQKRIF